MSRIGLRANMTFERTTGLLPVPAISSIAAVQTTFEHASGSIVSRAGFKRYLPSAHEYLKARLATNKPTALDSLLRKLRRLGPVCSIPSRGTPDAALVNIDLDKETIAGKAVSYAPISNRPLSKAELDNYLLDTLCLRTAPFTSLLLADVAQTEHSVYQRCLFLLERMTCQHAPTIVSVVAQEIQAVAMRTISSTPLAPHSSPRTLYPTLSLVRRRGVADLALPSLSSLNARISQNDYILLAHKILENPDFPVAPFWHEDYTTQRLWLDTAMQLPEESASGLFAHEVLLKKLLQQLNSTGVFPHPGKLRLLRSSAAMETQKLMKDEVEAAVTDEPNRLLRCKIEHLIPRVACNEVQHKALRLVALDTLDAANVMKLPDSSIVVLMSAKMQQIVNDNDGMKDLTRARICDIISDYSDDLDEHYWNDSLFLTIICDNKKRAMIQDWIPLPEDSNCVHPELFNQHQNYCEPLAPVSSTNHRVCDLKLPRTSTDDIHNFPVLEFQRDNDGNIVLPLDDGYSHKRSAGFCTNLSGLTGISSDSSSSYSSEGSSSVTDDHNYIRKDSTNPGKHSKSSKESSFCGASSIHSAKEKYGAILKDRTSIQNGLESSSKAELSQSRRYSMHREIYTYDQKRIATTHLKGNNARRLNTLRMAWDVPHRAHGPQQPGLRPYMMDFQTSCYIMPSPDWDLPGVEKLHFAQGNPERGLLSLFSEEEDAKEAAGKGTQSFDASNWNGKSNSRSIHMEISANINVMFVPPRQPHHDGFRTIFWDYPQDRALPPNLKSFQQERSEYEIRTMSDDGGVLIYGQDGQAWSSLPTDDPFVAKASF